MVGGRGEGLSGPISWWLESRDGTAMRDAIRIARPQIPKGPNLEKIQDLEIFKRDWNFQASHPPNPCFSWGILEVEIENFKRDWKFQARLKFSSDLEFLQDLGP